MIAVILFMIVVSIVVVWTIQERFFKQQLLTITQASEKVETLYAGKVKSFETKDEQYVMTMERNGALYDVQVDAMTGDVLKLNLLQMAKKVDDVKKTVEQLPTKKEQPSTPVETKETKAVSKAIITTDQAAKIAQQQLNGKIEYVVYEKQNDGGYYLVEIDGKKDEAVFQIHALTGKIMSVTHDEHEEDHEDDDDDHDDDEYDDDHDK